ncbi:hypothetical protein LS69_000585 [Helicobacter sp. MIT 05-5294]|nr:hypothetical protein LS69_000585 [Helicobacter sp. MIT 05-5294]
MESSLGLKLWIATALYKGFAMTACKSSMVFCNDAVADIIDLHSAGEIYFTNCTPRDSSESLVTTNGYSYCYCEK